VDRTFSFGFSNNFHVTDIHHRIRIQPAFIYDPRLTSGNVRQLAKKNLGKRHLLYFFECHDAPFSVLVPSKITKWEDGLMDDFHLGKTARSAGQKRLKSFRQALQAATLENHKPIEMRMDWNHSDQPQILPSLQPKRIPPPRKRQRRELSPVKQPSLEKITQETSGQSKSRSKPRGFAPLPAPKTKNDMTQVPTKTNLTLALAGLVSPALKRILNPIVEPTEDGPLFLKLLQKFSLPVEHTSGQNVEGSNTRYNSCKNVGFVKLTSRKLSTFADARASILEDLEFFSSVREWRFFVPGLGPVSRKQETQFGGLHAFLRRTTTDQHLGNGTLLHPLKVFLVELEVPRASESLSDPG